MDMKDAPYPMIRLEIEGMKYQIVHAFSSHNNDIQEMVEKAVEKLCTQEYIDGLVQKEVGELIPALIHDAINDWRVKNVMRETLVKTMLPLPAINLCKTCKDRGDCAQEDEEVDECGEYKKDVK